MIFPEKFYSATREMNDYPKHIPAPYIRKSFDAPEFEKAEILISGLGFYDLYINSQKITKGILAPYISNSDHLVYFDKYDVTSLLKQGRNAVGVMLGNGMQNAPSGRGWDFQKAPFRSAPKFAMSITYIFANGEAKTINADESFKCHPSPLTFDDLRSGNFYDATKRISDWCSPDFDDSGWSNVFEADLPRGEFKLCEADPITPQKELSPVSISTAYIDKTYNQRDFKNPTPQFKFDFKDEPATLYDFGVNSAGILRLKIKGEKGQRIFVQNCEFVTSKGQPSCCNIRFFPDGYSQVLHFICSGEEDVFESQFTYYGSRYAVVYGLTEEQKTKDLLTYIVCNSDLKVQSSFSCSDNTMNRLMEMAKVSDLANFYYFPTDCPHREKNGWTGDAAVSARHLLMFYNCEQSFKEWLRNLCLTQKPSGMLSCIVPTGRWGYHWGNGPAWDNALTELCWQTYILKGDLSLAEECSESMLRYLSFIASKRDKKGLVAFGLGDWLQPRREASRPKAPLILTDSVMTLYIANKSAELFEAMGMTYQAAFAKSLASDMRCAIRKNLIDFSTLTVHSRCQTAQAICIYYDVFDECEKKGAGEVLAQLVKEQDNHLDCGMIGLRAVFRALADVGYADLAYEMITREDAPSYGSFVRLNLTALPERFLDDDEYDYPSSLNHHFFGDITAWCLEYVAGIRPSSSDELDIRPCFIEKLSHAEGEYQTVKGKASVKWQREDEIITMELSVPDGIRGNIILPNGYAFYVPEDTYALLHESSFAELQSGVYKIRKI